MTGAAEPSLRGRARKGVFWAGLTTIGSKLLGVLTTLILARVLSPSAFGLVAVANVVVAALSVFTDLGLGAAIIHSKADRQAMASTAFFLMPLIGLTLYAVAFLTAPVFAGLLGEDSAVGIIRVVSLTLVFGGMGLVPSALLEKDMAYRRKVVPDLLPAFVYIVAALTLAVVFDAGAYSIAYGLVLQSFVSTVLNWCLVRWRPSLMFDRAIAGQLLGYGKHVLGGTISGYLATNMDNAFVSRTNGAAVLGRYTLAYNIANLPATHVADVIGRVLLPSLVEINEDPARIRRVFGQTLRLLVVGTFPLLAGLAAVASPFVHVLLGPKWLPAIPALQILVIFAALRVCTSATGSLMLATGNSRMILTIGALGFTLQAIALTLLVAVYDGGLAGASWAVSLASVVNGVYIGACVKRIVPFSVAAVARDAVRLVAPALLMGGLVHVLVLAAPLTWWALALEVATGAALYLPLLVLCNGTGLGRDLLQVARARAA